MVAPSSKIYLTTAGKMYLVPSQTILVSLEGHIVYFGLEQSCYSLLLPDFFREEVCTLGCSHEEAHSQMIYHLHHILEAHTGESIAIRSFDTRCNHSALVSCCESYN